MCMHFSFTSSCTPPFKTLNQDPQGSECKKRNSLQSAWISWSETCLIYSHGLSCQSSSVNVIEMFEYPASCTKSRHLSSVCTESKHPAQKKVKSTPPKNPWFASTKSWHPLWVHPNARPLQIQTPQTLILQKTPLQISSGFDTLGCLILEGV